MRGEANLVLHLFWKLKTEKVMRWMKRLKFPYGYTARLKRYVNVKAGKIYGLKSHDYYIIMERLLPIMLCGYLDYDIWETLAELSYLYRQLCAKEIKKDMMEKLKKEIPVIICKLEKNIFYRVVQSNTTSSCSYSI
jgi:hypothetical protein